MIACAAPFHLLDLWPLLLALPPSIECLRARTPTMIKYLKRLPTILLVPLLLTGCSNLIWRGTYAAATATSQLVDSTHKTWWADPLAAKLDACSPSEHPEITTTEQYDTCLGVYKDNAKVLAALETYNTAMGVLEEAMLATNPDTAPGARPASLVPLLSKVTAAAVQLLTLLPDGQQHVNKLRALNR